MDDEPPGGDRVFTDAHNYAYDARMDIGVQELMAGADSLVRWDAIGESLQGRPVDAAPLRGARGG